MYKRKKILYAKKIAGYTTTSVIGLILLITILSIIIFPKVSQFKAKGQQSEERIRLVRIYNSMYAYKIENGFFIDTKNKSVLISDIREIDPYLKDEDKKLYRLNEKVYIMSDRDKFAIAYVKLLTNGKYDIQRINSKKKSCFMLNGIEAGGANCENNQNYNNTENIEEIREIKKLGLSEYD